MTLQGDIMALLYEKDYTSPWLTAENGINELFAANSSVVHVHKNSYLMRQGEFNDSIYIVKAGRFRVAYLDTDGKEQCLYIAERGAMLGETAAIDGEGNYASAFAITDAAVYRVNVADLARMIRFDPAAGLYVMKSLAGKVRLMGSLRKYMNKPAQVRISASILAMCAQYGNTRADDSVEIGIKFTHKEMGDLNNLNRVTVTRTLNELAGQGIITFEGGQLVVTNLSKLKEIATS